MGNKIPCIQLNRHAERRLAHQHPWIYSNEIHETVDIKKQTPGDLVEVLDRHGKYVGTGFVNPRSLIAIRFLTRKREQEINADFFAEKIQTALQLRELFYGAKSSSRGTYRAVFGESDGLPGLVIDRYGPVWVIEFHALGMFQRLEMIQAGLQKAAAEVVGADACKAIVVRTDVRIAALEGLAVQQEVVFGNLPDRVVAVEDDIEFVVDPLKGQKTGFFFDQRENRSSFARVVGDLARTEKAANVLDLYCHVGAWGLRALKAGAARATFVDLSEEALASVRENAKKLGVENRCTFLVGDTMSQMKTLPKESFHAIALDPPSFISSKKTVAQGIRAYFGNNREAIRLLTRPGILSTSTCSFHCEEQGFQDVVAGAVLEAGRLPQLLERGNPAWDHPSLANMPESRYLKNLLLRV